MQGLISWLCPAKVNAPANVKILGMHWCNPQYFWYWPDEVDRVLVLMWKKSTLNILSSSMSGIHSIMSSHSDLWLHVTLQKNASSEFHKVRYVSFQFGKREYRYRIRFLLGTKIWWRHPAGKKRSSFWLNNMKKSKARPRGRTNRELALRPSLDRGLQGVLQVLKASQEG